MLNRIHIQGFKSLIDVQVEMAPLVIIFGPNAAGKSNYLEALYLLSRLVTERTLADAFQEPLRGHPLEAFTLPETGLGGLYEKEEVELRFSADVQPEAKNGEDQPYPIHYSATVRARSATGVMDLADERLVRLHRSGGDRGRAKIELSDAHFVVRQHGGGARPWQIEKGLNHSIVSSLQFTGGRYPDFDRLRSEMGLWRTYYLDPRIAMRSPRPPKEVTDIGPRGQFLAPLLYRLQGTPELRKYFSAVGRALQTAIPSVTSLDVQLDRKTGTLDLQVTQNKTAFSSRVISEGTLRVLALCTIAANPWPGTLVAFEEPENGVHPRRLDVIADLLVLLTSRPGRQVVVTTHSPSFVATMMRRKKDHPKAVLLLRCYREGRNTRIAPFDPTGDLFTDAEIRDALRGDEDGRLLEAMLRRGWLDGP